MRQNKTVRVLTLTLLILIAVPLVLCFCILMLDDLLNHPAMVKLLHFLGEDLTLGKLVRQMILLLAALIMTTDLCVAAWKKPAGRTPDPIKTGIAAPRYPRRFF